MKKKIKDFTIQEALDFCKVRNKQCDNCPFNNLACGILRCSRMSKQQLNQEVEVDE